MTAIKFARKLFSVDISPLFPALFEAIIVMFFVVVVVAIGCRFRKMNGEKRCLKSSIILEKWLTHDRFIAPAKSSHLVG